MASTYTTNLGIEKIGTGEQSGTWGDTTNTNFDILDEAVNGIISITLSSAGSSGSPTALPITDGASSNGRNKFIEFVDGGDLGGTAYVQLTPNDAEKIVHIRNSLSSSRSVIVFQGTYNASNDFEIVNGADVLLKFNGGGSGATVTDVNVDLTVTGATIATADINGGAIDGTVIGGASAAAITATTITGTTITASTAAVPDASDGATLGSASLEWSDLYLADGAVVFFGDDQDITLTHVADTGLTLKHANTGDDKFPTFLLATGDTDIAADDKLGVINFQAPDEGAGTDAILVAAGIEAVSEGDFSASSNATSLVFKTGASEAAAEKMRVDSAGNVGIGTTSPSSFYATELVVSGSDEGGVTLAAEGTTFTNYLAFADGTSGDARFRGQIRYDHNDDSLSLVSSGYARILTSSSRTEALRADASGDISIGSSSNHAGARVVINDTPPTAFGSPMFQVGQETFTGSGMYSIGFGYTAGSYTEPPVEIAAITTSDSGGTKADIVFGTRNATTNTAVTERVRIDSSGNVGIGCSPSRLLDIENSGGAAFVSIVSSTSDNTGLFFGDTDSDSRGRVEYENANDAMKLYTAGSTRVTVDSSGNFLVGTTTLGGDGISLLPRYSGSSTTSQIRFNRAATSTEGTALLFMDNSVIKGSIKYTNSATSFNTSSDQRLKENIVDAPAGNIDDIRVRSFDWRVDGSHQKYGVVAQELVNAAPEAVTVEDDEEKTMQVDHSKLVPMMIKEIQDLKAEVAALKGV
tara:strand:+ start:1656 stop:3914 length:2259 start_codon:yes stop_codon:yes gene_type:complete